MKRFLLSLFVAVLSCVASAQTTLDVTFPMTDQESKSAYKCTWTGKDADGNTWSFVNFNNNNNAWSLIKCGWKTDVTVSEITSPVIEEAVTEYAIVVDQTSGVNSCKLEVLVDGSVTDTKDVTLAKGTVSISLSGTKNAVYHLVIDNQKVSSNGTTVISKLSLTKAASEGSATKPSLTEGCVFSTTPFDVVITNNEAGSTVYYTVDGADPTTSSASFTGESKTIQISETTTVKAMAVASGKSNSAVVSATYTYEKSIANTLETAYTTEEATALIDAGSDQLKTVKVYVKGTVSKVDKFNDKYGSITYWVDNNTFEIYGCLNNNGEKFASIDDVKVGAEVVCYGIIKKYNTTYEMDQNGWLVSYKAPSKPEATLEATYQTELLAGTTDTYGVTTNSDGNITVTSSDAAVAEAEYDGEDVLVRAIKAGTTVITLSVAETANYLPKTITYTLTVTEPVIPAAVPFAFDGGKDDATPASGVTATGLGSDYKSSPKLKFDGNGDNMVINIAEAAKFLHYTIKGNGNNSDPQKGTFTVQESADGETYTTLKNYDCITGQFRVSNISLKAETRFVKFTYVEKTLGNVALGDIKINNEAETSACATFDEYVLDEESTFFFESETPSTAWTSGGYTFTTHTEDYGDYGKYYFSYALSNKTTTTGVVSDFALEASCGKANSGKNYAVWYDNSYNGGSKVTLDAPSTITGFYVTNTTSVVDAIINGDGMSTVPGGFQNGDKLQLVVTGYDASDNEVGTVTYTLAEAKDDVISYVKAWRWVDLSSLGTVAAIETKMTSTKVNDYGMTTPAYFCIDDLGGVAPETDAAMATADVIPTAIVGVDADVNTPANGKFMQNGRIVIINNGRKFNIAGQMIK